jgi:hypothetical protein
MPGVPVTEGKAMGEYKLVVLSSPVEGREDEYKDWYGNRHVPDVVKAPGFVSGQFFKLMDGSPRYMALYEMECDDPAAAFAALRPLLGTDAMPISSAMDGKSAQMFFVEPITGKVVG